MQSASEPDRPDVAAYAMLRSQIDDIHARVERLLMDAPGFREENDKDFVFSYWYYWHGFNGPNLSALYDELPDPASIVRIRRFMWARRPELRPPGYVIKRRAVKKAALLDHIWHETTGDDRRQRTAIGVAP